MLPMKKHIQYRWNQTPSFANSHAIEEGNSPRQYGEVLNGV